MKKFLAIMLIMIMTMSVVGGCSNTDQSLDTAGEQTAGETGSNGSEEDGSTGTADTDETDSTAGTSAAGTSDETPGQEGTAPAGESAPEDAPGTGAGTGSDSDRADSGRPGSDKSESGKTGSGAAGAADTGSDAADITVDTEAMLAMLPTVSGLSSSANDITEVSLAFNEDGTFEFGEASTFYSNDLTLTISAPAGAVIYYTLDGRMPDTDSTVYDGPLSFTAHGGSFPSAYILRAMAVLADGTASKTAARSYIVSSNLQDRFTTLIFSVTGDPDDLTEAPDGIFYGTNYNERGRESEREVYVEVWEADGTNIISQFAGVRIYGGYSRQNSVKSMKLFARKSYDADNKNFKFSDFGTLKLDGSDKIIKKYDKLVLRDCGNDFQFSYIRDELSQTLCKLAGFECYEAVLPAVAYLNGEYYGFFWLHKNYTDKYFKEKYGDAEGEFIVAEGSEKTKNDDDDPVAQAAIDEYNEMYNKFINMDLTDDDNYRQLCEFMDVESYLDFFAWNIILNNKDWPNNNYKCFKYVEADAETLSAEGAVETPDNEVFDGRWRFLVHDMDYSYGLYDQTETQASYNTLRIVMNKNNSRYAPLFTLLMERADCRNYFRAKTYEYVNGALSEEVIVAAYNALHATRADELHYYYQYLEQLNLKGDWSIWSRESHYANYEEQIYKFAKNRGKSCIKQMEMVLPEL